MPLSLNRLALLSCDRCNGKGKIASSVCPHCKGKKIVQGENVMDVYVEAGMPDGHLIVRPLLCLLIEGLFVETAVLYCADVRKCW